jgi:hypothetical protein
VTSERPITCTDKVPLARDSPDAFLDCRGLLTLTFYWKLCIVA